MKMGLPARMALGIALLGAVAATDTYGQDFGTAVPGIASFQQAGSHSPVPLVAVFSFVSLILGLAVMFTGRPPREQLTPLYLESGLRRAQLAMAAASAATQAARTPIMR